MKGIWQMRFDRPLQKLLAPEGNTCARRGFSFAEVMFAVVIMGVGFIMIAALFPVAIRQSKSTTDETISAANARAAANFADAMATDPAVVANAVDVKALPTFGTGPGSVQTRPLWNSLRGNIISQDDARYAWVPFIFRGAEPPPSNRRLPYAQLILVCVQSTIKPTFDQSDIRYPTTIPPTAPDRRSNLQGRPIQIVVADCDALGEPDLIGFRDTTLAAPQSLPGAINAVAEGSFVIVRGGAVATQRLMGKIYRVGARRTDKDNTSITANTVSVNFNGMQVWELQPGYDFKEIAGETLTTPPLLPIKGIGAPTEAWIVGRAFKDNVYPVATGPEFEGPAMDVSIYSTFIFLK